VKRGIESKECEKSNGTTFIRKMPELMILHWLI